MRAECFGGVRFSGRLQLSIDSVASELPGLTPVAEADVEDLPELFPGALGAHRARDLDAVREISRHPIRGCDEEIAVHRIGVAVGEVKDPRVLEETTDDGSDADALGPAGNPGSEAAEPANDQLDRHAGPRRPPRPLDDLG